MHPPRRQLCPLGQGLPEPQRHCPVVQRSARPSQAEQLTLPVPQAPTVFPGLQAVADAQQPVQPELPLQTHCPPVQTRPEPQAGLLPQRQAPLAQLSAFVASHGARQLFPLQQPAHELASHTQLPALQRCPAPQAGPLPHWQTPLEVQMLARTLSHAMQAAPFAPQVLRPCRLQVDPEQQPPAQVPALHPLQTPLVHDSEPGQLWQVAPPLPQAVERSPVRQALPLQQPGQELESQTQTFDTQRWWGPQAALAPHWQLPLAEQLSEFFASQLTQVDPFAPQ
jgi:hypothetical protein